MDKKELIKMIEEQIPENAEFTHCFSSFIVDSCVYHFDMKDGVWYDPKATGLKGIRIKGTNE